MGRLRLNLYTTQGEFVKIQEFSLKLKILKFLGIQSKYTAVVYLLLYITVYMTVICYSIYTVINDIIMGVDCNYVYGIVSLTPPKTLGVILRIIIKKKSYDSRSKMIKNAKDQKNNEFHFRCLEK